MTCGRRPIRMSNEKPAADFSARALDDYCDDGLMPVICPTCQTLFLTSPMRPRGLIIQAPEPGARLALPGAPERL